MGIGFADEFHRKAKDCVEGAENCKVSSFFVRWKFASQDKHNCKEDQPFEDCFVELGWMPRHISRKASEVNRPRQIAWRTPKLTVNEVRATTEEQANRHTNKCKVQQTQILDAHNFRTEKSANKAADKTSVEAHATFVDCKNFQRVSSIISVAVEKHIAQPRPNYDAGNSAQNAREDFVGFNMNFPSLGNKNQNNAGTGKTQDVSDAISPNSEAANLKSYRINTMKQFIHTLYYRRIVKDSEK